MNYSLSGSSVHGILQARIPGVDTHSLLQGNLPNPGIKRRSPALETDFLPSEPPDNPQKIIGSINFTGRSRH